MFRHAGNEAMFRPGNEAMFRPGNEAHVQTCRE